MLIIIQYARPWAVTRNVSRSTIHSDVRVKRDIDLKTITRHALRRVTIHKAYILAGIHSYFAGVIILNITSDIEYQRSRSLSYKVSDIGSITII